MIMVDCIGLLKINGTLLGEMADISISMMEKAALEL